jgi:hypothetical protein
MRRVGIPEGYLARPLSAIRASATAEGGFSLLAVLVYVADEHPAAHAGLVAVAALVEATWRVRLNEGQGE